MAIPYKVIHCAEEILRVLDRDSLLEPAKFQRDTLFPEFMRIFTKKNDQEIAHEVLHQSGLWALRPESEPYFGRKLSHLSNQIQ